MTDRQVADPPARNLPALLQALSAQGFTGSVRVHGPSAGSLHLREGLVTEVRTPGAPSTEARLLRSRRISEEHWNRVCAAAHGERSLSAALLGAGQVSAAELAVLCADTIHDGAFAMALTKPEGWETDATAPPPGIGAVPGIDPGSLTEVVTARLALLTRQWGPPAAFARTRIVPASRPGAPGSRVPPRYQDILLSVDGRRTPRDIAFMLGRGVYAVMLDLARMKALQLLQSETPEPVGPAVSVAPRSAPTATAPPAGPVPLPRRTPAVAAAPTGTPPGANTSLLRELRGLWSTAAPGGDQEPGPTRT